MQAEPRKTAMRLAFERAVLTAKPGRMRARVLDALHRDCGIYRRRPK